MRKTAFGVSLLLIAELVCARPGQTPELKDQSFTAKILAPLSASANKKGDKFTLAVLEPETFKDAMIEAEVVKAKAAGRVSGRSELLFSFNTLTPKGGAPAPIVADLKEVTNSKGTANTDEEGRVIGKSSAKKDVTRTAIFGGIGAAIGGIAGGGSGAAKGAAIGAAIGLTIAFSTQGEDIRFDPGSKFKLLVSTKPAGKSGEPSNE
jgi:hypothetical protein